LFETTWRPHGDLDSSISGLGPLDQWVEAGSQAAPQRNLDR